MRSWVYFFSKFSAEALLFEALILSILGAVYSAFWIMKKRRFGVIGDAVPDGVMKDYLNTLIYDAKHLRSQLFGLLIEAQTHHLEKPLAAPAIQPQETQSQAPTAVDPALEEKLSKFAVLEKQVAEQAVKIEQILSEKTRLLQELDDIKAAGSNAENASADDSALIAELKRKLQTLESRLSEYSVIEDDLANLKRLQQENLQLKTRISGLGNADTSMVRVAGSAVEDLSNEEVLVSGNSNIEAEEETVQETAPENIPEDTPENVTENISEEQISVEPTGEDALFNGLVEEVEKSLQPAKPQKPGQTDEPEENINTQKEHESGLPPRKASHAGDEDPNADADLVAEFEKMLGK
ncbi:MAG: hypothetical protein AABZ06_06025 [Bdellovibrionota bacterium]